MTDIKQLGRSAMDIHPLKRETILHSVEIFLAHTIRLEQEAARRFEQLADAMLTSGNREAGQLFKRLAHFSRLHLAEASARAGFRDIPALDAPEFEWPDIESPESAAIWAADPFIGREQALQVALDAESAGLAFYQGILNTTKDAEIRRFAEAFVAEEGQHVAELERWLDLHRAGQPLPLDRPMPS
jgi:rubrerythrin